MKYKYKILNYWNDSDDLYVNYLVENLSTHQIANAIEYFNTSDIGCDYNDANSIEIENCLLNLVEKNNGVELSLPKVSELSPLLKYVYDTICHSESTMCHVDYDDWKELKDEVKKYHLEDYIVIDDGEYKICGYGGLPTKFNDDRRTIKNSDNQTQDDLTPIEKLTKAKLQINGNDYLYLFTHNKKTGNLGEATFIQNENKVKVFEGDLYGSDDIILGYTKFLKNYDFAVAYENDNPFEKKERGNDEYER